MRTKKAQSVSVITLGCSKNIVDSEVMVAQLNGNGIEAEHEKELAETIIINTCGFIDNAKEESIDAILHYCKEKKAGNISKLMVTGCLSHRYMDELELEIPEVDAWFGTMELPVLLNKLGADYKHELLGERVLYTSNHTAFLKISEGCDRPCAFCAIPLMRGKHRSKSIEELEKEAHLLASRGTKELVLIAQDSTYYGLDIYKERALAKLLKRLTEVDGIEWIRIQYAYPSQFPVEVLELIAQEPKICSYLDIPLQHASDNMLKAMRRGISSKRTQALVDRIRAEVPGIAIRTTMISGFPGETEEDHQEMLDFVRKNRFERLGVFAYSHEESTAAFNLQDNVPEEIKEQRVEEIMELQQSISTEINQKMVGKEMSVMIDRKEGDFFIGRTEYDSPEVDNEVLIDAKDYYLPVGSFVRAKIIAAQAFDLYAEPIKK